MGGWDKEDNGFRSNGSYGTVRLDRSWSHWLRLPAGSDRAVYSVVILFASAAKLDFAIQSSFVFSFSLSKAGIRISEAGLLG